MTVEPLPPPTVTLVNFDGAGAPLVRFDVEGDPIDAHGGGIYHFEGSYYLYGETYGCGFQWQRKEPVPFCGFRVYSSPNLVEWKDHGLLFEVSAWDPWQSRCHWFSFGCFRPRVAYNRGTGKYVLWVNSYHTPVGYYVLESSTPTGPFVERGVPRLAFNAEGRPGLVNNGDHNLFVDDDGTGYVVYTEWAQGNGDMVIEQLTPDYLSGTGRYARLGVWRTEAPSMFKRNGRYYLVLGDPNCAYCPTGSFYYTATSPLGPWSRPRKLNPNSCGGQPTHVSRLPAPDGKDWYLYQSDLWLATDPSRAPGGDLNQAPAPQFWAPLTFDSRGEIEPVRCDRSFGAPALLARPPAAEPELFRLHCDVGTQTSTGALHREVRFTAPRSGRLHSVTVNAYQRNEPSGPLTVEVRTVGGDTGRVLASRELQPKARSWDVHPEVAWTAREHTLPVDAAVAEGETYAVRLRADLAKGCYGVAVRDDLVAGAGRAFVSRDGGSTWTAEPSRTVRFGFTVGGS